jgi:hypothetical protein
MTVGTTADTDVDRVNYTETNEFGDGKISGFRSGNDGNQDLVVFSGTLNAAYDDFGAGDDSFTFFVSDGTNNTNESVDIDAIEALLVTGVNDGVTDSLLSSASTLVTELNNEFAFSSTSIGDDLLIVVNATNSSNFAVWQYIENGASADVVSSELTLIGVFNSQADVTEDSFALI